MRGLLVAILLVLISSQLGQAATRPGTATAPTYTNPFLRAPNYTINISRVPYDLVTPAKVSRIPQTASDALVPGLKPLRFDPRACAGQVATCYQVLAHNATYDPAARGVNRTNLGSYTFPYRRARFFTCIADDLACVRDARSCWCADQEPIREEPLPSSEACSDTRHLCQTAPGFFIQCEGNLTACRERFGQCSCGLYGTCTASRENACVSTRHDLFACQGSLAECLDRYDACACGTAAIQAYQPSCAESRHRCSLAGANITCEGSFRSCALQYDTCACGGG